MKTSTAQLTKITVNAGVGKVSNDAKLTSQIEGNLAKITGQKPVRRNAAKAIAGFKLRKGDLVGYTVTLRSKRMRDFLGKLTKATLPGNRDFKGIDARSIDERGNLTIGITDMTIFPELQEQSGSLSHGLEVTLVADHKKEEPRRFYERLGIPFKKE